MFCFLHILVKLSVDIEQNLKLKASDAVYKIILLT